MDHSQSPGMLLIFPKGSKKPVGHIAAIVNSNSTGWVSLFVVDEAYRGKGLGRALWEAMMEDFHKCGTKLIGLDGVLEQKGNYERKGFVESTLGTVKIMSRPLVCDKGLPNNVQAGPEAEMLSLDQVPHYLLAEHELKLTGVQRTKLWTEENIFSRPDAQGWALVRRAPPQVVEDILAWTVIRRCSGGARIGPVYADNAVCARSVLAQAMNAADVDYIKALRLENEPMNTWSSERIRQEATMIAEVWTGIPDAVTVFEELGWSYGGADYHRMWLKGTAPKAQSEGGLAQRGLYAIFDAAIG